MSRLVVAAVIGVAAAVYAAQAPAAAPSPIGTWKTHDGLVYRWTALDGGGYAQTSLTAHQTPRDKCPVPVGTVVYRYHPLGGGLYAADAYLWRKDCSAHWSNRDTRLKLAVTATTLTLYDGPGYRNVWWSFTRRPGDSEPPFVEALRSTGTVGGTTSLRYVVNDNSGRTWDELTLYRAGLVARRYRTPLGPAVKGRIYAYKLAKTPAEFRGTFRFCVRSHDAAGNVSASSCSEVTIT